MPQPLYALNVVTALWGGDSVYNTTSISANIVWLHNISKAPFIGATNCRWRRWSAGDAHARVVLRTSSQWRGLKGWRRGPQTRSPRKQRKPYWGPAEWNFPGTCCGVGGGGELSRVEHKVSGCGDMLRIQQSQQQQHTERIHVYIYRHTHMPLSPHHRNHPFLDCTYWFAHFSSEKAPSCFHLGNNSHHFMNTYCICICTYMLVHVCACMCVCSWYHQSNWYTHPTMLYGNASIATWVCVRTAWAC